MDFTEPCAAASASTTAIMHIDSYTTFSEAGVGQCDPALVAHVNAQRDARAQLLRFRCFIPHDGVSVFIAPSPGKGLGLFSSENHRAGTVIAHVSCSIVKDGIARAGLEYIEASKCLLLLCEPPTLERPGSLANTQTARRLNNAKFVISVSKSKEGELIPQVKIVLTQRIASGAEVFVDYGAGYRSQLRQLNRTGKHNDTKKRTRDVAAIC